MSYDRRWLEELGSEDSHGRTLWALLNAREGHRSISPPVGRSPPRPRFPLSKNSRHHGSACAFHLGLDTYCTQVAGDVLANRLRRLLADRLMIRSATASNDWVWFEDLLAYDNALSRH